MNCPLNRGAYIIANISCMVKAAEVAYSGNILNVEINFSKIHFTVMEGKFMKIVVIIATLSLCLFSCGGDADNTEENNDSKMTVDTIDLSENMIDEEIIECLYSTVEDYGQIGSKEQLISEFGEENLVDGESWYAEGTVRIENTVLTNPENGQVIKYLLEDDGNTINYLEVNYYIFDENFEIQGTQAVSSEYGVSTGMSLQDLKEWNGADFRFFGFGWDYEGGIFEEEGTRIAECPIQFKLSFDLEIEIPEEYRGMYSDQVFNTADDITQGAPVLIDMLTYRPAEE
ncbi:MAG: hypothetical protein KAR44_02405 [Candidatus Aegiribacteria sp.]|nr:hypothetical protein [Candidatus Aegiribacteria sp.]